MQEIALVLIIIFYIIIVIKNDNKYINIYIYKQTPYQLDMVFSTNRVNT